MAWKKVFWLWTSFWLAQVSLFVLDELLCHFVTKVLRAIIMLKLFIIDSNPICKHEALPVNLPDPTKSTTFYCYTQWNGNGLDFVDVLIEKSNL